MNFTEEQVNKLKEVGIEEKYITIMTSQFMVGNSKHFQDTLTEVYKEATGETLRNWNCSTCVFNNVIKIAKIYFASLEEIENERLERCKSECTETTANVDKDLVIDKPKRGRPKQIKK